MPMRACLAFGALMATACGPTSATFPSGIYKVRIDDATGECAPMKDLFDPQDAEVDVSVDKLHVGFAVPFAVEQGGEHGWFGSSSDFSDPSKNVRRSGADDACDEEDTYSMTSADENSFIIVYNSKGPGDHCTPPSPFAPCEGSRTIEHRLHEPCETPCIHAV